MSATSPSSLLGAIPDSLRGPVVNLAVSMPLLTVGFYVFGRRFTRQFYWRFGIDDSVLSFSVQDYVIRSEGALLRVLASMGWVLPLLAVVAWVVLHLIAKTERQAARAVLGMIAVVCLLTARASFPDEAELSPVAVWYFALLALVGVRAAAHVIHLVWPSVSPIKLQALLVLAVGIVLVTSVVEGAQREGRYVACTIDRDRHTKQPVTVITTHPLHVGTMTVASDQYLHSDLRLFNRTPAGYLVFGLTQSPSASGMTLVPVDSVVALQFAADHREVIADPGAECRALLA